MSDRKRKEDNEVKFARAVCILMTANRYKYDLPKFVEFIQKNKTYFPNISENDLELIKKGKLKDETKRQNIKEQVPKFADMDYNE